MIWLYGKHDVKSVICATTEAMNSYLVIPDEGPDLISLPNLTSISWPHHKRPKFTRRSVGSGFELKLSEGQYKSLERLLRVFEGVMISLKLHDQWFLAAGTLIGSIRHHDIIPWDDDVDVCVDLRHRKTVQSALRNLPSEFRTYAQSGRDKLYFTPMNDDENVNSSTIGSFNYSHVPWAWPFIDILYFRRVGPDTAVEVMWESKQYDLKQIFPVIYRPFGQHWYPAPHNPVSMLSTYYFPSKRLCVSSPYSHAAEMSVSSSSLPCSSLFHLHAFVQRCPVPRTGRMWRGLHFCDEHLVDGRGQSIHKIRTLLYPDDTESSYFAAHHASFSCP
ncbi:Lipopolysaccharide cholinephosphotransferase LicD [Taenia solium]|eukprot:TsM_000243700 transcript=TsM_000243700 gene=TsM_000243700